MKNLCLISLLVLFTSQVWAGPKDLNGNDLCDKDLNNKALESYKLVARCNVVSNGNINEKALFRVENIEVCIRKSNGWLAKDSYVIGDEFPDYLLPYKEEFVRGYFYATFISPLSATYVGKKPSKDHLFPGSKSDPVFQPGQKIEGDYIGSSGPGFFVTEAGAASDPFGAKAKHSDGNFTVVEKQRDGMSDVDGSNPNYFFYKSTLSFDRLKKTMGFKYERGGYPVTLSWKNLVDINLACEVEPEGL